MSNIEFRTKAKLKCYLQHNHHNQLSILIEKIIVFNFYYSLFPSLGNTIDGRNFFASSKSIDA